LATAAEDATLGPMTAQITGDEDPVGDLVVDSLELIQKHFPLLSFPLPKLIPRDEVANIAHVAQVLNTGTEEGTWLAPSVTLTCEQVIRLIEEHQEDRFMFFTHPESLRKVLGVEIDMGESVLLPFQIADNIPRLLAVARSSNPSSACTVHLRSKLVDGSSAIRRFKKFWPTPDTVLTWAPA
jgi:hypothetical protein